MVLSGDAEMVRERIAQNPNVWKYTSGVLSFAPEDGVIDAAQEQELIEGFEDVAFAGIASENRVQGLWVRHSHAGHHEMHYLYPRQLNDGRSYNMRPPGDIKRWDAFRDVWNISQGWADPDDPERARAVRLPNHLLKVLKAEAGKSKEDIREIVHRWAVERIEAGVIENRTMLIEQLQEEGFDVPRQGKDYITIAGLSDDGNKEQRVRCKGGIFSESFRSVEAITKQLGERNEDYRANREGRLEEAEQRLERFNQSRASSNIERYTRPEQELAVGDKEVVLDTAALEHSDLSGFLDRHVELGRDTDQQGYQRESGVEGNSEIDRHTGEALERVTDRADKGQQRQREGMGASALEQGVYPRDTVNEIQRDIRGSVGQEIGKKAQHEQQQQDKEHRVEHTDSERERVDTAGAWLDWAGEQVDRLRGGIDGFIERQYAAAEKRKREIIAAVERSRKAYQAVTKRYIEFREKVELIVQPIYERNEARRQEQQKERQREIERQLERSKDRGMSL